jgi:hypothetical protein
LKTHSKKLFPTRSSFDLVRNLYPFANADLQKILLSIIGSAGADIKLHDTAKEIIILETLEEAEKTKLLHELKTTLSFGNLSAKKKVKEFIHFASPEEVDQLLDIFLPSIEKSIMIKRERYLTTRLFIKCISKKSYIHLMRFLVGDPKQRARMLAALIKSKSSLLTLSQDAIARIAIEELVHASFQREIDFIIKSSDITQYVGDPKASYLFFRLFFKGKLLY